MRHTKDTLRRQRGLIVFLIALIVVWLVGQPFMDVCRDAFFNLMGPR